MNLYELIDDLYQAHAYLSAGDDKDWPYMPVRQMLDAYAALAPNWSNAPKWAQWYAIDADGITHYYEMEPRKHDRAFWVVSSGKYGIGQRKLIPENIDWRLCKWMRQQPLSTHKQQLSHQEPTP